jgi:serine beta-lactamase-like protein LACTB, mitochondrial
MQTSRRHLLLGAALVSACASTRASAQPSAVAEIARSLFVESGAPALSAAVCSARGLVWSGAFGKADLELNVDATPAHAFRLGSVAKIITASLAARLESQGRVDLNAAIGTYAPDLPAHHRATTLVQLLTHRGGVRHYNDGDFDVQQAGGLPDTRPYRNNAEILALFINDPLIAAPGANVSYSTFGYTLASIVLEAATGTPFVDLVREEIALPLGLTSLQADNPFVITPNRVRFYSPPDEVQLLTPAPIATFGNAPASNPAYKVAGGGMIMSASDLARFGAAHLTPGHWPQAALDRLFTLQTAATPRQPPLGLGWRIDNDEVGRLRWHHAGTQYGCRAALVVYPRERLAIALATNLTATPGEVLVPAARFADAALA